jgi:hypothetical protein
LAESIILFHVVGLEFNASHLPDMVHISGFDREDAGVLEQKIVLYF